MSDDEPGGCSVKLGNPFGCLFTILSIFLLWAALFGVTVDGKHYGASCSCERGVEISK